MNRNTKIILGIVGGLVLVCICGAAVALGGGLFAANKAIDFAAQNMTNDPQKIADLGDQIASFDAPEGFKGEFGMDLMGMTMVGYTGADQQSHIFMIQFPANTNLSVEEMERQLNQAMQSQQTGYGNQEMKVIENREVTVKGQKTTANIAEGSGNNGTFRQLSVAFNGNGGPALLVYNVPAATWDDTAVDDLLASIQ